MVGTELGTVFFWNDALMTVEISCSIIFASMNPPLLFSLLLYVINKFKEMELCHDEAQLPLFAALHEWVNMIVQSQTVAVC